MAVFSGAGGGGVMAHVHPTLADAPCKAGFSWCAAVVNGEMKQGFVYTRLLVEPAQGDEDLDDIF